MEKKEVIVLLFENYETLDAFGPVEIFGRLTELYDVQFYSLNGGIIGNQHNAKIATKPLSELKAQRGILLIPGGIGTRAMVENTVFLNKIKEVADSCDYVLTVCTGSAILAKTGLLDNRYATSNKRAFEWVITNGENVKWDRNARWTVDGKYYTSAGVSAGIDMSLGFLSDHFGIEFARKKADEIEFNWLEDKNDDTFKVE